MRHVVYRTICTVNLKEYTGVSQEDKFNGYLGSGVALKAAIKKYGRDCFKRLTLHEYDSKDDAYAKERELVTEEYARRSDTYNLCLGGVGGCGWVPGECPEGVRASIASTTKIQRNSPEWKAKASDSAKRMWADPKKRAKASDSAKRRWADPKRRVEASATQKRVAADPERRAKRSAAAKRQWANPESRARLLEGRRKSREAKKNAS